MSLKKVLTLVLALMVLVAAVSACGPAGDGSSSTADKGSSVAKSEPASDGSEEEQPGGTGDSGDYPTISLMTLCGAIPADSDMVAEALSEITREKLGCNIELINIEIGNWATQLNLLLSGGDDTLDVYYGGGVIPYSTVVSNGQALVLDDLLAEYEDGMKDALTEKVYESGRLDGKLYGVGRLLDQASTAVYNLRADIAGEFGYKNGDKIDLEKLTKLFADIREAYPDTPLIGPMNSRPNIGDTRIDNLGDENLLGVLGNFGQDDTVTNYYESEGYLELVEYFKQWKEMGCYMTDILNVTEAPVDYIPAGKCFGNFAGHFSAEMNGIWASQNYGVEMASLQIYEDAVAVTPGAYYCINPATQNAEMAAGLLNLMATDADVVNLLINGIEGQHYTLNEDGSATYVEGKDVSSTGWSMGYSWTALNSTLSHPFEYPADYYDQLKQANADAHQSKAFGCQFDMTGVSDAVSACTNVVSQYADAIKGGTAEDIDAAVAQFQSALKDAGIDEIIAEKQAQLDAFWVAQS